MTQVFAGHGVFGEYLQKIGREATKICHHCGEGEDTAEYTLELYTAWEAPRRVLRQAIGESLNPSAVVEGDAEGATGVLHSPLLLRRSNARKRAGRVGEGEMFLYGSAPTRSPAPS